MSKALKSFEQPQVYSFLQKALETQDQQTKSMQIMLAHMMQIENNVNERFVAINEMVSEVRDSITLTDAECFDLQRQVFIKSTQLTKSRYREEDEDFKALVGKYRRMIWSKLKEKFGVAKYVHIRRIDYKDAMSFVETFRPEDYM